MCSHFLNLLGPFPPLVVTPVASILLVDAENLGNDPFERVELGEGAKLFDPDLRLTLTYFEFVSLLLFYPDALFSLCRLRVPLLLADGIPFALIVELKNSRLL